MAIISRPVMATPTANPVSMAPRIAIGFRVPWCAVEARGRVPWNTVEDTVEGFAAGGATARHGMSRERTIMCMRDFPWDLPRMYSA